jgi:hypothetical protein
MITATGPAGNQTNLMIQNRQSENPMIMPQQPMLGGNPQSTIAM